MIEQRLKTTTIRAPRKFAIKSGDLLSLREWTGKPYRSKQRLLGMAPCTKTEHVEFGKETKDGCVLVWLDGRLLYVEEWESLALRDGFPDGAQMLAWFREVHGLPFKGVRISWGS